MQKINRDHIVQKKTKSGVYGVWSWMIFACHADGEKKMAVVAAEQDLIFLFGKTILSFKYFKEDSGKADMIKFKESSYRMFDQARGSLDLAADGTFSMT